jgi:hypothetical protein
LKHGGKLIFYLSFGLIFWIFALVSVGLNYQHKILVAAAIIAFVMLAGFRLETGYDWMAYEQALTDVPPFSDLSFADLFSGGLPDTVRLMEPLFIVLLSMIKEYGGTIQTLYFIVALFNGLAFYAFVRHCRANVILAFAIYFCWLYLPVQMGVMRQSIALSFMMLSLIRFDKSKYVSALALFLLGTCFQYSLVIFIPTFFTGAYRKLMQLRLPIVLILMTFYFLGFSLFDMLGVIAEAFGPNFISEKIKIYLQIGTAPKSAGATVYFLLNVIAFLYLSKVVDATSRVEKSLVLVMLLMIATQAAFWQFPLLWNRVQYFVVIAQSILLFKAWKTVEPSHVPAQLLLVLLLSIAALLKPLLSESASPYLPYQSSLRSIYTNDPGDGRERTADFYYRFIQELPTSAGEAETQ